VRRDAILTTASEMLRELSAADISLNELSRRTGMAKSNVLRYFESREAILLELCNSELGAFVDQLTDTLAAAVDTGATLAIRSVQLVETLVAALAARPVLCDLMSEQAGVLEHNVSTAAVLEFKRVSIANVERLSAQVVRYLPELGPAGAGRFTALTAMLSTSIWTHSHPPPAVVAAYEAEPSLAPYRLEFTAALRESLQIVLAGLLAA